MRCRAMTVLCAVTLAVPCLTARPRADVVLTQKQHTDGCQIMGQTVPASDRTVTTWIGQDAARLDQGPDTSVIVDFGRNQLTMVLHKEKAYVQTALQSPQDMVKAAMDADKDASEEDKQAAMQMMQGMMGAMKLSVTVTETPDTKKVKSWNCRKYLVKTQVAMAASESEMWVTQDVKIDPAFYQKALNSRLLQMPGAADAAKEWAKLKGIPALSTTKSNVMGATVAATEELLSAETKAAPQGTYAVPAGYKAKK